MFSDEENDVLRELGQTVIASMFEVIVLILVVRIWNSVARKSRNPDRFLLRHEDFDSFRSFTRSFVRKQFNYQPPESS
jgi:hypothetical protein